MRSHWRHLRFITIIIFKKANKHIAKTWLVFCNEPRYIHKTLIHTCTLTTMNVHMPFNGQLRRTWPENLDIDEITMLPLKDNVVKLWIYTLLLLEVSSKV